MRRIALAILLCVALAVPCAAGAAGAGRSLVASPNPVATGDDVVAQGRGFCGRASCPAVQIVLNGIVVRRGLRPRANGTFAAKFVARVGPGTYSLIARQGWRIATTRLHVALAD
jgi:hypothetical protein